MTGTRAFFSTAVLLALATAGFTPPVSASDPDSETTEADFVRDMTRRLGNVERRIEALQENLSRSHDVHAQRRPMRGPRTNARELTTGPGGVGSSLDDFARIELKLERLERKARDAEKRLGRHEATHVRQNKSPADDPKAEKSRRKITSRITQMENELDELERELRYLR